MGPVLIWPKIKLLVGVVFQEILALTRGRHILCSERVTAWKNVVISIIQMQMICYMSVLFEKWISKAIFLYRSYATPNNPFLSL